MPPAKHLWRPPEDAPPARVFHSLIRRPRPRAPLAYRYPRIPDVAFHVVALTPFELAEALDVDADGEPSEVVSDRALARMVVAGLRDDHGPALASEEQASRMPQRSWCDMMEAAVRGIAGIMPSRALCSAEDWAEWRRVLDKGARAGGNIGEAFRMRDCHDIAVGWGGVARRYRPDRYYGLPIADLTDGHLLAFDIAVAAAEEIQKKASASREPD